jgi:hypothetical protein
MDADKVESSSKSLLKGKFGDEKIDSVKCPDGKDAKKGVNFECTFKGSEGTTGSVNIEVTSTDGDANISVKTVKHTVEKVQDSITADFKSAYPEQADALKSVVCPDEIPAKVGDTTKCTLTDTDGQTADLTVTMSDDQSLHWDFSEITG